MVVAQSDIVGTTSYDPTKAGQVHKETATFSRDGERIEYDKYIRTYDAQGKLIREEVYTPIGRGSARNPEQTNVRIFRDGQLIRSERYVYASDGSLERRDIRERDASGTIQILDEGTVKPQPQVQRTTKSDITVTEPFYERDGQKIPARQVDAVFGPQATAFRTAMARGEPWKFSSAKDEAPIYLPPIIEPAKMKEIFDTARMEEAKRFSDKPIEGLGLVLAQAEYAKAIGKWKHDYTQKVDGKRVLKPGVDVAAEEARLGLIARGQFIEEQYGVLQDKLDMDFIRETNVLREKVGLAPFQRITDLPSTPEEYSRMRQEYDTKKLEKQITDVLDPEQAAVSIATTSAVGAGFGFKALGPKGIIIGGVGGTVVGLGVHGGKIAAVASERLFPSRPVVDTGFPAYGAIKETVPLPPTVEDLRAREFWSGGIPEIPVSLPKDQLIVDPQVYKTGAYSKARIIEPSEQFEFREQLGLVAGVGFGYTAASALPIVAKQIFLKTTQPKAYIDALVIGDTKVERVVTFRERDWLLPIKKELPKIITDYTPPLSGEIKAVYGQTKVTPLLQQTDVKYTTQKQLDTAIQIFRADSISSTVELPYDPFKMPQFQSPAEWKLYAPPKTVGIDITGMKGVRVFHPDISKDYSVYWTTQLKQTISTAAPRTILSPVKYEEYTGKLVAYSKPFATEKSQGIELAQWGTVKVKGMEQPVKIARRVMEIKDTEKIKDAFTFFEKTPAKTFSPTTSGTTVTKMVSPTISPMSIEIPVLKTSYFATVATPSKTEVIPLIKTVEARTPTTTREIRTPETVVTPTLATAQTVQYTVTKPKLKTEPVLRTVETVDEDAITSTGTGSLITPMLTPETTQTLETTQLITPQTLTKPQTAQVTTLKLSTVDIPVFSFKMDSPEPPPPLPPPALDFDFERKKRKERRRRKTISGFDVYVKMRGEFKPIGKGITLERAVAEGVRVTAETPARTFKVLPAGAPLGTPPVALPPLKKYYVREGKIIERAKYAIETAGEIAGISMKGVEAQRLRRMKII